jgi:hypothetical protein
VTMKHPTQEKSSKVPTLGAFKGSEWRQRFADALLRLLPHTNPDAADELSDSQFVTLSELPPERAAEAFVASRQQRGTRLPDAGLRNAQR